MKTPLSFNLPLALILSLAILPVGCKQSDTPAPTATETLLDDPIAQAFIEEFAPKTNAPATTDNGLENPFPDEPIPDPFGLVPSTNNPYANSEIDWDRDLLKKNALDNYKDGKINFALLRKTENYRKPAPNFPPELQALNGKTTEIIGFISPYDDIDSLKRFFVSNIASGCNFCTFPSLKDMIFVESKDGKEPPTGFGGLVRVKGTLKLKTATSSYHSQDLIDEGFDHNIFDECIFILHDAESTVVKGQGFTTSGK